KELLHELQGIDIILLAHESNEQAAVAAFRAGAWDYLAGGPNPESIRCALQRWQLSRAVPLADPPALMDKIVGSGDWANNLRRRIAQLAASNCNVLITGETG